MISHIFAYGDSFTAYPTSCEATKTLTSLPAYYPKIEWYRENYLLDDINRGWVYPIVKNTKACLRWFGYSGGVGNEIIFTQAYKDLTIAIQNNVAKPDSMLFLVNWTFPERYMLYSDDLDSYKNLNTYPLGVNNKTGYVAYGSSFIETDKKTAYYYEHFYNYIHSFKIFYEQVLLLKMLFEKYNVKWLMTNTSSVDRSINDHPEISPLISELGIAHNDRDLFLPAIYDWVNNNIEEKNKFIFDGVHPTDYAYEAYYNIVVAQFFKDKNIVV